MYVLIVMEGDSNTQPSASEANALTLSATAAVRNKCISTTLVLR